MVPESITRTDALHGFESVPNVGTKGHKAACHATPTPRGTVSLQNTDVRSKPVCDQAAGCWLQVRSKFLQLQLGRKVKSVLYTYLLDVVIDGNVCILSVG